MGEVGGDAGGVDDIVEGELVNEGRGLEEQGQWLEAGQYERSKGVQHHTWPMPPEAPATTALTILLSGALLGWWNGRGAGWEINEQMKTTGCREQTIEHQGQGGEEFKDQGRAWE
jgi:hypothetical protein